MLCLNWLRYFGRTRRASQQEYRRQIDQTFAQVIPSPWDDLRHGLVLGGESLWNRARELLDQAEGHEEIRWRWRADGDEVSRLIASLVAQEADRRVAVWLRVRVGGQRMTELANEYGYRDGSGVHRVVHRLEQAAKEDRNLAHRLQQLADRGGKCQELTPCPPAPQLDPLRELLPTLHARNPSRESLLGGD